MAGGATDGATAIGISIAEPEFSPFGVGIAIIGISEAYEGGRLVRLAYYNLPWFT